MNKQKKIEWAASVVDECNFILMDYLPLMTMFEAARTKSGLEHCISDEDLEMFVDMVLDGEM